MIFGARNTNLEQEHKQKSLGSWKSQMAVPVLTELILRKNCSYIFKHAVSSLYYHYAHLRGGKTEVWGGKATVSQDNGEFEHRLSGS